MEDTLAHLAKASGIPYAYVLIDSFWYREGPVPTPSGSADDGFGGTLRITTLFILFIGESCLFLLVSLSIDSLPLNTFILLFGELIFSLYLQRD